MTIDRSRGGGPWTFENEHALDPGEYYTYHFERDEKGRYRDWAPMDEAIIKNFNESNRVRVTFNGQFDHVVDPNGVDSFGRAGIVRFTITNEGGTTIDAGDVIVSTSVEPYSADDQALEQKVAGPLKKLANGVLGL